MSSFPLVYQRYRCKSNFEIKFSGAKTRNMKITSLLFWVQENEVSEKFYKKLGFEVVKSDDRYSIIELNGFQIILVNIRDEETFASDSMNSEKGRGMYVYIMVDDVDAQYKKLETIGLTPATK